jgi:signal transduction histidine kinase
MGGTGLGLSITNWIVHKSGGTIQQLAEKVFAKQRDEGTIHPCGNFSLPRS